MEQGLISSWLKAYRDFRGEKCFSCDECTKTFERRTSLRKHCINKHESKALAEATSELETSVSYKCDVCPKKFIKKIFLTNHKLRIHGLDKKFLCQVRASEPSQMLVLAGLSFSTRENF